MRFPVHNLLFYFAQAKLCHEKQAFLHYNSGLEPKPFSEPRHFVKNAFIRQRRVFLHE